MPGRKVYNSIYFITSIHINRPNHILLCFKYVIYNYILCIAHDHPSFTYLKGVQSFRHERSQTIFHPITTHQCSKPGPPQQETHQTGATPSSGPRSSRPPYPWGQRGLGFPITSKPHQCALQSTAPAASTTEAHRQPSHSTSAQIQHSTAWLDTEQLGKTWQ